MVPITLGVIPIVAAVVRTVALHAITAGEDVTCKSHFAYLELRLIHSRQCGRRSAMFQHRVRVHGRACVSCPGRSRRVGFSKMTGPQDADVVELVNTPATEKNAGVRETRSHDPAF